MTNRNDIWLLFERKRDSLERRFRVQLYRALRNQARAFAAYAKVNGISEARARIDSIVPFEYIANIIKVLYLKAGIWQANETYGLIKRETKDEDMAVKFVGFGFNEKWTQEIIQYFQLHLLNKAVLPITATTKSIILRLLTDAAEMGLGVEETVAYLLKQADEISKSRARVIVRTESVRAMNYGAMVGAKESRLVMVKEWITARDERVRHSHRRLDNQTAEMEGVFENGLAFPGDRNGSARETVNCRCTLAFIPKRDANGRLIKKPANDNILIPI